MDGASGGSAVRHRNLCRRRLAGARAVFAGVDAVAAALCVIAFAAGEASLPRPADVCRGDRSGAFYHRHAAHLVKMR